MKHRADGGGDASSKLYGSFPAAEDPGANLSADAPAGPAGAGSFRGGANPIPPPNARPPSYRKIERGSGEGSGDNDNDDDDDDGDERVCRICLEEDSPETMIAPCRCKGSSRWVHRECLDEWRTNERDRAFSRCTECLFEYHLEPVFGGENESENDNDNESGNDGCGPIGGCCGRQKRRRCLFYWMVSRDVCTGILLQQLVVVLLGAIVRACDGDRRLPELVSPSLAERSAPAPSYWYYYYGFGWLAFLIATGVCGLVVLCTNGCNLKRAIPRVGPPSEADGEAAVAGRERERERSRHERSDFRRTGNFYHSGTNYNYTRVDSENDYFYPQQQQQQQQQWRQRQREHERQRRYAASPSTQYYRRARRRHRHYRRRRRYCDDYDDYYCYYGPAYHPVYVYPTGSNDCCCCCDSRGPSVDVNNIPSGGGCCDCDFGGCMRDVHRSTRSGSNSSNGDGNDAKHVLLVVLLVVAIVMAIVGFFVGVLVVVVAIQRIVARHVHLLQKRQLVQEYRVVDLQDYDLDTPVTTAPAEGEAPAGTAGTGSPEGFESTGVEGGAAPPAGTVGHPPPSAPVMTEEEAEYLRKLGLMDRRR